ncbi:MAG TPA: rRNA adenine N-6-methyltransferase family protein [Bryobacteraceae bacterium]|nr:rRNA adenine N-6-methyltransferase family protein [Bryobacteraceae bacterium]
MTLEEVRQFYAEEIRIAAPLRSHAVGEAFARVPRENFLGPGPWQFGNASFTSGPGYFPADDTDPRHVYHNVTVALDMSRTLCNGQPSAIGYLIDNLDIQPGERVFHLGCATGYFTAIMAEVTGPSGQVVACEVDADLAARAQKNLAGYPNVTVHTVSGTEFDPGPCDAMLINAGVTVPLTGWLDRLAEGGRMAVALTIPMGPPTVGKGMVAKVTRRAGAFAANILTYVAIYSCEGGRNPELEPELGKAMGTGALMKLASIRREPHAADETCIVHGTGICLSSAAIPEAAAEQAGR